MGDTLRLAISNIAWETSEDEQVADVLRRESVGGIEIAPTKWRERPLEASASAIAEYRKTWADRGLRIVSMQALLFGRPDLQLFGPSRASMRDYLRGIIELGARLGAHALVFGSPKNRARGSLSLAEATAIAVDFFREIGEHAAVHDVAFCLEANPPEYGCDFITDTAEAVALCAAIDHPGIAVNGDLGGMTMSNERVRETIASAAAMLGHFHASEPQLAELGASANHAEAAAGLAAVGYGRWVSVEMRAAGSNVERVERAIRLAKRAYGEVVA
ncbi:MAG TPA: TIM barrel protein [Gemmatimonadaceae bacterium]